MAGGRRAGSRPHLGLQSSQQKGRQVWDAVAPGLGTRGAFRPFLLNPKHQASGQRMTGHAPGWGLFPWPPNPL